MPSSGQSGARYEFKIKRLRFTHSTTGASAPAMSSASTSLTWAMARAVDKSGTMSARGLCGRCLRSRKRKTASELPASQAR